MQICSSFSIFCFFNYNQKKDDLFHYVNQLVYDFHIYLVMGYWISKHTNLSYKSITNNHLFRFTRN